MSGVYPTGRLDGATTPLDRPARTRVVELGAGASSLLLAAAAARHDGEVWSVEDHLPSVERLRRRARALSLPLHVIQAPICDS